jgi:hypothetical protein
MIGKKREATELARILELTETIPALLCQVLEKIAEQDRRITTALQKIQQTLESILPGKTDIDAGGLDRWLETRNEGECALIHWRGQCPAFEQINDRIEALADAVMKRDELEAEIVKLKKILERRGRRHG